MLTEDHQRQRIDSSPEFLHRYADENDNFLASIVTGDETWGFNFTPETKQQSRERRHSSSPKPRKCKRKQSTDKIIATVFWYRRGVLLVDFMAHGTTIKADRYCETLKKPRRAIQNSRRGMLAKGVCLLQDNARPHFARQTFALLDQFGWDIITQPHYSPDLVPCDYHLFPKLKVRLAVRRFSHDDEVKVGVQRFLNDMAAIWYDMGIQKLPLRLQKCIDRYGDYVKKRGMLKL